MFEKLVTMHASRGGPKLDGYVMYGQRCTFLFLLRLVLATPKAN